MASTPFAAADRGRRLRIALITSSYDYIKDGVALTLNRLVGYLEGHGVDVLVFAPTVATPSKGEMATPVIVERAAQISSPGNSALIIGRVLVESDSDLSTAHSLTRQIQLSPLTGSAT